MKRKSCERSKMAGTLMGGWSRDRQGDAYQTQRRILQRADPPSARRCPASSWLSQCNALFHGLSPFSLSLIYIGHRTLSIASCSAVDSKLKVLCLPCLRNFGFHARIQPEAVHCTHAALTDSSMLHLSLRLGHAVVPPFVPREERISSKRMFQMLHSSYASAVPKWLEYARIPGLPRR
jgi:hypothetical protein